MRNLEDTIKSFQNALLTRPQQIRIVWTWLISSLLGLLGSGMIIFMILVTQGNHPNKYSKKQRGDRVTSTSNVNTSTSSCDVADDANRKHTMHDRLLLAMSIMDLFNLPGTGLATTPFPSYLRPYVYGANGNATTCRIQGFFNFIALSVPFYSAMLCVYYFAILRLNLSPCKLKILEWYLHGIALLIPLGMGIYGLIFDLIQPRVDCFCWIGDTCEFAQLIHSQEGCRPQQLHNLRLVIYINCYSLLVIILISMGSIYLSERKRASMQRIGKVGSPIGTANRVDDDETLTQASLYILAFFCSYVITTTVWMLDTDNGEWKNKHFLIMFQRALFFPLQGLWNFLIYLRPRYLVVRQRMKEASFIEIITISIFRPYTHVAFDLDSSQSYENGESPGELNLSSAVSVITGDKEDQPGPILSYPSTFSNALDSVGNDVFSCSTMHSINDLSGFGMDNTLKSSFSCDGNQAGEDDKSSSAHLQESAKHHSEVGQLSLKSNATVDIMTPFNSSEADVIEDYSSSSVKQAAMTEESNNAMDMLEDSTMKACSIDESSTPHQSTNDIESTPLLPLDGRSNTAASASFDTRISSDTPLLNYGSLNDNDNAKQDDDEEIVSMIGASQQSNQIQPIPNINEGKSHRVLTTRRNLTMLVAQDMVIDDIGQGLRHQQPPPRERKTHNDDGPPIELYLPQDLLEKNDDKE